MFAAGFDIAAAETVAAGDDLPAGRVADLVARLAERSMLTRPGASGVGRYRMLETLRAYAASRLPADEAERFRRRHAGFMVDLAERAEAGLYGPDEPAWARRVERWLDDLRAAWGWARDAGELDLAARLAAAVTRYAYWRLHGDLLAWGTWVAATVPAHPRLAVAYAAAAAAAWSDGRLQEARDLARRGVEVGGGPATPAAAAPLEALGDVAMLTGDLAAALEAYRGVAALAAPGDPAGLAIATANLALTLAYAGDDQAARATAEAAVAAALASANPTAIAMARFAEGEAFADADPARAAAAAGRGRAAGQGGRQPVRGRHRPHRAGRPPRPARPPGGGPGPVPRRDRPLAGQPQPHPAGHHPAQPRRPAGQDRPRRARRRPRRHRAGGGAEPVLRRRGGPDRHRPGRGPAAAGRRRLRPRPGGRGGQDPRGGGRRRHAPARPRPRRACRAVALLSHPRSCRGGTR